MTTFHKNSFPLFTKFFSLKHFRYTALAITMMLFFATSALQAQECPPKLSSAGAIEANGPILFDGVGNCTPVDGMIQWNSSANEYQAYHSSLPRLASLFFYFQSE